MVRNALVAGELTALPRSASWTKVEEGNGIGREGTSEEGEGRGEGTGAVLEMPERAGAMEGPLEVDGGTADYCQTFTCNSSDSIAYTSVKISA